MIDAAINRRPAGGRLRLAVVGALVTCTFAASLHGVEPARAATSGSWLDPAGDAEAGAPDLEEATLERDPEALRWTITATSATTIGPDVHVDVVLDADGVGHWLHVDGEARTISHYRWDATTETWQPAPFQRLEADDAFPLHVAIDRTSLGDPRRVAFYVRSSSYEPVAGVPWRSDRAPSNGVWTLDLSEEPPATAPPGGTSPVPGGAAVPAPGGTLPALPGAVAPTVPGGPVDPPTGHATPPLPPVSNLVPPSVPASSGAPGSRRLLIRRESVGRRGNRMIVRLVVGDGRRQVRSGLVSCTVRSAGRTAAPLRVGFVAGQARCELRLKAGRSAVVTVHVVAAGGEVVRTLRLYR